MRTQQRSQSTSPSWCYSRSGEGCIVLRLCKCWVKVLRPECVLPPSLLLRTICAPPPVSSYSPTWWYGRGCQCVICFETSCCWRSYVIWVNCCACTLYRVYGVLEVCIGHWMCVCVYVVYIVSCMSKWWRWCIVLWCWLACRRRQLCVGLANQWLTHSAGSLYISSGFLVLYSVHCSISLR